MGLFLCSEKPNNILEQLKPEWNNKITSPVSEKLILLHADNLVESIFPFTNDVSDKIDKDLFVLSHLRQPDLFLRLRPGKEEKVKQKLSRAEIPFEMVSETCLALPNASKIDAVIELNKEAVVQDYNSQRVGELGSLLIDRYPLTVWDCCAASGGKSIMLYDLKPDIDLVVSDVRESILINLKKRFRQAGITKYKSIVADLAHSSFTMQHPPFDLVIADVPCSGSGTWGRTPEQLFYFEKEKIAEYASLQKKIISNVIPHLKPGGYLLYITCSVFKKENEEAVDFAQQQTGLQLVKMEVLKGYDKKADTLFAALLQKPL